MLFVFGLLALAACRKTPKPRAGPPPIAHTSSSGAASGEHVAPPGSPAVTAVWNLVPPLPTPTPGGGPGGGGQAARAGGTLRVHLDTEPANLNPFSDDDRAVEGITLGLVYEPLFECAGEADEPVPLLAERGALDATGNSFVVELRRNLRFSDGHPLSPVDVQATLEPLLRSSQRKTLLGALLADVATVSIGTDGKVAFALHRPTQLLPRALCEIPIVPWQLIRGNAAERAALARQPVGTGPFRLLGWERGRRIRLGASPTYATRGAPPPVREIHFEIESDAAKALVRGRRGGLDLLPRVLDVHFPDQVASVVRAGTMAAFRLEPMRFSFLAFNTRQGPLADARFRRALGALWDRRRMADEFHNGLAIPIVAPGRGGEAPAVPFDRAPAEQQLTQAGFSDSNHDGVRDHQGRAIRLRFLHVTGARTLAREAHLFALELRRAGLLLDLQPVDPAAFLARLSAGDFEVAPLIWQGAPGEDPRPLYGPSGPFNHTGFRSPALDGLLEEFVHGASAAVRAGVRARLHDLLRTEAPVAFLYRDLGVALAASRVKNLTGHGDHIDLRRLYLDPIEVENP